MKKKNSVRVTNNGINRREFGQRAALAFVGAAFAGTPLAGLNGSSAVVTPSLLSEQGQGESGLSPQAQAEVESKLQHIFATYGSRLNADQKKLMRRTVGYHVRMLEAVRPMPVANGDPPATVLKLVKRPTRKDAKGDVSAGSSTFNPAAKFSKREN